MSKQLHMYALPTDIQRIIVHLSERIGVVMISPTSPNPEPSWIESPIRNSSLLPSHESTSVKCCLVPSGLAQIRFKYYAKLSAWHVTDDSEVIFVSGCDFDGEVLVRGRFYCQTDMLNGEEIVPKNLDFVRWADRVFRLAKKNLQRSQDLDAYIGSDALAWEKEGGRFASLALPGHKIIFAVPRRNKAGLPRHRVEGQ